MCFDVRHILGKKKAGKFKHAASLYQRHASIPPKTQKYVSSKLSATSLKVAPNKHHYIIPPSSLRVLSSHPVTIPPRTTSVKLINKRSDTLQRAQTNFRHPSASDTHLDKRRYSSPTRRELQAKEVKILAQWYRGHVDRPYPTPSEKRMLARQCGISTLQVSCWFSTLRKSSRRRQLNNNPY